MIYKIKNILKKKFTKIYWESSLSCNWHNKRKNESLNDFDIFAEEVCSQIENYTFHTIIEVGTGSGTLITLLSEKINTCNKFIGIDINKKQIAKNRENYRNLNEVEFLYVDIKEYINYNNLNNSVLVAQNTLDYFNKNELLELFSSIYNKTKNILIIVNTKKSNTLIVDSIEIKENGFRVFEHNYHSLLKSIGYEINSANLRGGNKDTIAIAAYKL